MLVSDAGKTSAAPDLLRDAVGIHSFVKADLIAEGSPVSARVTSPSRPAKSYFPERKSLPGIGRTLRWRARVRDVPLHVFLRELESMGYQRHIFCLWLPWADLAVARVHLRVAAGGHDVAESIVRRRFEMSLSNF